MSRPPRGRDRSPNDVKWDSSSEQPLLGDVEDTSPFNPLDTKNLAIAVTKALLERRARGLSELQPFRGAGIYAIYYAGAFPPYDPIAAENRGRSHPRWPIYVGKAIPPGGRRGAFNLAATDTTALYGRLREHAESVSMASNLEIQDFSCRFLVVQDLWIPLAEGLLISHFAPIWNRLVDGFGNHDPGSGRYNGYCPRWDALHPGRPWALKCKPRVETAADIDREIVAYLEGAAIPSLSTFGSNLEGT